MNTRQLKEHSDKQLDVARSLPEEVFAWDVYIGLYESITTIQVGGVYFMYIYVQGVTTLDCQIVEVQSAPCECINITQLPEQQMKLILESKSVVLENGLPTLSLSQGVEGCLPQGPEAQRLGWLCHTPARTVT